MQIAPNFTSADWRKLDLATPESPDWSMAIDAFEQRLQMRFFDPIECLRVAEQDKRPTERRFGFAVLALDCMLLETLASFRDGLEDTIGRSKEIFCGFLRGRPEFSGVFDEGLASSFYYQFRCGVLHQTEVAGRGKIWSIGPIVQVVDGSIIVNRNALHDALTQAFHNYLNELRDPENVEIRSRFARKMTFISRT
jgi:hypothetical protein